jgi:type IIS restriction enzyme R and M protein
MERLEQTGATHIIDGVSVKSRKKTKNKWFETQDSISYWNEFFKHKIIWGNLALSAQFTWAEEGYFINAPSSMIVPGNKYLLAVLNSKLADWYIRQLGVTRNGGYFEYKPMFVEQLPVPMLDEKAQIPYIRLVDKILEEKRALNDTQLLESEINQRVYALYHLSEEEIRYIESQ